MSFPTNPGRKAFQGKLLLAMDAVPGTVWCFPQASVTVQKMNNIGRPSAIDGNSADHLESPGMNMLRLSFTAYLMPDRNVDGFLNAGFGPRFDPSTGAPTNASLPMVLNLIPYGGGSVIKATGIWLDRCVIAGQYSAQGGAAIVRLQCSGYVLDPNNFYSAPTLTAPASVGTNGAGPSSFVTMGLTDSDSGSYGNLRSFSLAFDNRTTPDPGAGSTAQRIAEGCTPGPFTGAATFEQMWASATPLPLIYASAGYPFTVTLPTGDGTHALQLDLSASHDGYGFSLIPDDYVSRGTAYTLFGNQGEANGTGAVLHPFVASYS